MSAITEQSPLPSRQAVRSVVEGLVGRNVDFGDGLPVKAGGPTVTAVYVTDKLNTAALAVVDLAGAARLGGALGLVPKGGVDDFISEGELPENLKGNCYEVLNVMASVFNVPDAPHVKLYQMYSIHEVLPGDIQSISAEMGNRMDVSFDIAGYGRGGMSVIIR